MPLTMPEKLRSTKDWQTTTIWGRKATNTTRKMGAEAAKRRQPWSWVSCGGRMELMV